MAVSLDQAMDQATTLPPAQPQYILRGHSSQIHAVVFLRQNTRLLTGDGDGWVVLWNVATKRAVAVWRAHKGPILGLSEWGPKRIITHGRDTTLKVWELTTTHEDTLSFSTVLPVDDATAHRKEPWLLHDLSVNTLSFCSFSFCREQCNMFDETEAANRTPNAPHSIYLAVPGSRDSEIDVHRLPTERRMSTVPAPASLGGTAMLMATRILFHRDRLLVIAGYESGHTCVFDLDTAVRKWHQLYACRAHAQPVLSLDVAPAGGFFFTSSADDILARHQLPVRRGAGGLEPTLVHTKHAGQQGLRVRSDERIFATAGWDSRVRVYSVATMEELAVLKWHKDGCYAAAFATLADASPTPAPAAKEAEELDGWPLDGALATRSSPGVPARSTARQRREARAHSLHWLAAGSKDGKVSLWDIY